MRNGSVMIIVAVIIAAVIGAVGVIGYQKFLAKPQPNEVNNQSANSTPEETISLPAPTPTEVSNLKTYRGKYATFQYPNGWMPKSQTPFGGGVLETVNLGIPGVTSDQTLGFSTPSFNEIKPNDVVSEIPVTISTQSGFKWVRKGDNYVSYDYCTQGHYQDAGSFCVHVTVSSEDKLLETQLDSLAKTIKFE